MLQYKMNVIQALKDAGYNSGVILRENLISQSTMQKLRSNEMIGINALDQICGLLNMQPGDLIEYKK